MKSSLGLIEVSGLALAITVVDLMAKSANIKIANIEQTNGSGWISIRVTGDVGSVQAAIDVGAAFANQNGGLQGMKVIPRPTQESFNLWVGDKTLNAEQSKGENNKTLSIEDKVTPSGLTSPQNTNSRATISKTKVTNDSKTTTKEKTRPEGENNKTSITENKITQSELTSTQEAKNSNTSSKRKMVSASKATNTGKKSSAAPKKKTQSRSTTSSDNGEK